MNFYHVIYVQEPSGETVDVYVYARTQQNAIAAAHVADASFSTVTTVETIAQNVSLQSSAIQSTTVLAASQLRRPAIRTRVLLAIGFLFLLALPLQATTTVTGTIQTLGTTNITQNAFVRFWLRGCGGNQPRVNGIAVISPSQGGVFYFDLPANSSGQVSGTIYSTRDATGNNGGDIECGGSTTAVWYGMQIFVNGKGGPELAIVAKNTATIDISNVTPITTHPVLVAPTGDSTYARVDAGNQPLTSSLQAPGATITGAATISGALNANGNLTMTAGQNQAAFQGGNRTFAAPTFGIFTGSTPYAFSDASPDSSNSAAQLNGHMLPYQMCNLYATGTGLPTCAYLYVSGRGNSSNTPNVSDLASLFNWADISFGGRYDGVWGQNTGVALNTGFWITSISRTSNVVTATIACQSAAPSRCSTSQLSSGDSIWVTGETNDTSFNGLFTLTSSSSGTLTWNQTAANSSPTAAGFVTLDAQEFGWEINHFNNLGDAGASYPGYALGSKFKPGFVATENGTFSSHAAFYANSSVAGSSGNQWHAPFLCQDSIDGCFTAGVLASPTTVLRGTLGFVSNEVAVAANDGSSNQPSLKTRWKLNYGTGSGSAEHTVDIQAIPGTGANPSWRLAFLFDGGECCSFDNAGNLNGTINLNGADTLQGVPIVTTTATQTLTNKTLTSPTLTGLTNGSGLQLLNTTTTCTTAASAGATCTTASISLPANYSDTNYRAVCTGLSPTNIPVVETVTKSNGSFTITIVAITAAAATFASYDCIVSHN